MHTKLLLVLAALCTFVVLPIHAQTLTVIHAFTGANDGAFPYSGMTWDGDGNLYGTTTSGGKKGCNSDLGCGTVFRVSRSGLTWVLTTIYRFQGKADGWNPFARVVFGPDGSLYGTTQNGGNQARGTFGFGTVFRLTPPRPGCQAQCEWTHTVLYRFTGGSDGANPGVGDLIFDGDGNIYGTTESGGLVERSCVIAAPGCGVVFELSPAKCGWTEHVLYSFTGGQDGDLPIGGVIFDPKGNLLGTTSEGGASSYGTVFQLILSGATWQEKTLHAFSGYRDGAFPAASLFLDRDAQAVYGTTSGSLDGGGTVFQLSPSAKGYAFETDYLFPFPDDPSSAITQSKGNLYGTTPNGGNGWGTVFEMVSNSGVWTVTTLYTFQSHDDGSTPEGNILVDSSGNIYGTTSLAGAYYDGVIYEITP